MRQTAAAETTAATAATAAVSGSDPALRSRWLEVNLPRVEEQLALDEALLEEAHEGRLAVPVARTWMASELTVVVGSSSRIDDEVDRDACRRLGARIVRRPSGGLTVVLGPGCVMWSVVTPLTGQTPAIERIHASMLDPLAAALVEAGRPVVRRGSSDLAMTTVDGDRKVSGNALRVRRGGVLYHGTLLDDFDLDLVGRVLRHPPREPAYRGGRGHDSFLANLGLGRTLLEAAVRDAFAASDTLDSWPCERVAALVQERYARPEWTERLG
ncbi:MAG: lipoate--protein ligase family protein [Pirellulales bacterium]